MQAVKVFNNNAVSVVMPDGREAILVGNGLGFGRRPGDVIDKSRVSKVYYVQNELQTKFLKMLDNVTPQVMQAAERISLAAEEQGILLSSKSTISLVDHISFALERVEKGTFLPNLMLSETRMLYPKEYAVGQRALELVRQFCGVQLPEDEAGYIALHLVAGAADGALAYDTVKFVMAVKEIICDTYHCTFEEESLETIRLTMFISIPAAVGLGVLAFPITGVLFPSSSSLSGKLLMMGAVSVVFSALSTITNSVLQSIGQQKKALHNAAISLGMDLIVLALILAVFPKTNIYAVVFAGILFSLSMCVLNNLSIRKHLNFRNEFKNTYVKPLIAAAIMGVVTWVVYYGLFAITKRPSISMLIAILIAIVVYLIAFVVVTGTTEAEMRRMPMGTKLVKVLRILRIY